MDFFISAQDLHSLSLGLMYNGSEIIEDVFAVSPEQYLQTIDTFLNKHEVLMKDIKRIVVVPGPGSFTASRVSVTLANTMAFTLQIPMINLPNSEKHSLRDLCSIFGQSLHEETVFVAPLYDRPPMITQSREKVL